MNRNSKILIAGSNGMVGSAIVRKLVEFGYTNLVYGTREHVDFTRQLDTEYFFRQENPEYVFMAAAKVGGIVVNQEQKAEFLYQNLMIQSNTIHSAYTNGVKKLLFLGSSCIYPKFANQPITEDQLLSGKLESSNDAYALAKISGIKLCENYRNQYSFDAVSLMPTNLYGINDNFDLKSSHVIPALIRKFYNAKKNKISSVEVWGDGSAMREFLHVDDLASACLFTMENYSSSEFLNVGTGQDISIRELVYLISELIEYTGEIVWDTTKPNGTPRKVLDVSRIKKLGWQHTIDLKTGLRNTIEWYRNTYDR